MASRNAGFCSLFISPWPLPILLQCRWVKWVWNQTSPLGVLCQNLSPWISCKSIVLRSRVSGREASAIHLHSSLRECCERELRWEVVLPGCSVLLAVSSRHTMAWRIPILFMCVWCLHMSMHVWMDVPMCVSSCVCLDTQVHMEAWGWHQVSSQFVSAWFTEARPLS